MAARITDALKLLADEGYRVGPAWHAAHELAQAHEGDALYDRLHALCHRIEGDNANAAYWYRSAGVPVFVDSFAEEAAAIRVGSGSKGSQDKKT